MEQQPSLSPLEEQEFRSISGSLAKDPKVESLCLKYYFEFKSHQTSIHSDKIALYLKCAYYLAEKSQWVTTVQGQKVRSAGLSLNELLKKHSLEEIMFTLKEYSKRIKIQDPETLEDLQKLIKEISFLITLYGKFDKNISKLELKEKNNSYTQTLTEFVWLLYIEFKNTILNRSLEIIDNTCMIAHTLCFVLVYSWDYYQPGFFYSGENCLGKNSSRKQVNLTIKERILEMFIIKHMETYKNIAERFETYFQYLQKNKVIKMTEKDNFLSPELIQVNYKRFDHFYQKRLDFNHLDERIFFKDRTTNITPSKFTPFARQRVHIHNVNRAKISSGGTLNGLGGGLSDKTIQQGNYLSHRILNYDAIENQEAYSSNNPANETGPTEIKLPKTIIPSPMTTKAHLIAQTPYTTSMMMFNYVNELSNRFKSKRLSTRKSDQLVFKLIDDLLHDKLKDSNESSKDIKSKLIFSIYKLTSEEFFTLHPGDSDNEGAIRAILVFSIEVVFFVTNVEVTFSELQDRFDIDCLSLWRACDFFLKFDRSMPANLRVHLLDLEVEIISEKIWADDSIILSISSYLKNQPINHKTEHPYADKATIEKLTKRVFHQIAFQIVQLCKNCIDDNKEIEDQIAEDTFDTMKEILLNHLYMLLFRNVDQVIMCSLFSTSKVKRYFLKFQDIKDAYINCNVHLSDQKKNEIFTQVYCENSESPINIIQFYNKFFLLEMNEYVKNKPHELSRPQTQRNHIQKDVNLLLQSPLGAIITKDMGLANKKQNMNAKQLPMKTVTPRLHAYTESPLLKNDFVGVKNPVNSKKVLDFDSEEVENTQNPSKKESANDTCKQYQESNRQVNNYFNKKCTDSSKVVSNNKNLKIGTEQSTLIKSPCTKSPTTSPSPRYKQTLVKEGHSMGGVYYTKRDFGKNVNMNVNR